MISELTNIHARHLETSLEGRYITLEMLQKKWLKSIPGASLKSIGTSVQGRDLPAITLGKGQKRVLMWSQMHGNESTTTKAVADMVNFLQSGEDEATTLLDQCTLCIIPMLNPDGAYAYTRVNANQIDLNRDAQQRTQPESIALRQAFEAFNPHYCFNLHGQRTLFSAGKAEKPATVSFLSPASNPERDLNPTRETAMKLIVAMNKMLQATIPGQVGRYDDAFNENCVGDAFQMLGVPTILFEAGHYPGDYKREKTRGYLLYAMLECLKTIALDTIEDYKVEAYFKIPENEKLFYDILITNPQTIHPNLNADQRVGIRFKEVLRDNAIAFEPEVADIGALTGCFGHVVYDGLDAKAIALLSKKQELLQLIKTAEQ